MRRARCLAEPSGGGASERADARPASKRAPSAAGLVADDEEGADARADLGRCDVLDRPQREREGDGHRAIAEPRQDPARAHDEHRRAAQAAVAADLDGADDGSSSQLLRSEAHPLWYAVSVKLKPCPDGAEAAPHAAHLELCPRDWAHTRALPLTRRSSRAKSGQSPSAPRLSAAENRRHGRSAARVGAGHSEPVAPRSTRSARRATPLRAADPTRWQSRWRSRAGRSSVRRGLASEPLSATTHGEDDVRSPGGCGRNHPHREVRQ